MERHIRKTAVIPAARAAVWEAWTTEAGLRAFLAPDCRVEARVDGPFEIIFLPDNPAGQRGTEDMRILALQPPEMLSFTWNAPPHLLDVRDQRTVVQVWLTENTGRQTTIMLIHGGWGRGGQWDEAFVYFERAWDIVLNNLEKRFREGPLDWSKAP